MNCSATLSQPGQELGFGRWGLGRFWFSSPQCWERKWRRVLTVRAMGMGQEDEGRKKRAIVVGGGWAGFGAAHALAKDGFAVTLLDAALSPGGLSTGFRTAKGRPVEAGIKGFWWQYKNIFQLVKELEIPWPFTDWTRSSFYSPGGIQVEAPVFNELPRLPSPLGSFIYTSPYFRSLPIVDRLTAVPLLQALIEFDTDEEVYRRYDEMSARELFRRAGVSARLYREFLEPILLVTLFAPGEQLSGAVVDSVFQRVAAAAALGALYYYVLAHQADFDVCWCKGSVAETIFRPWIAAITAAGGKVVSGKLVKFLLVDKERNRVSSVLAESSTGETEVYNADVLVFAVGVQAMQRIVASCSALAERSEFSAVTNLGTVDVLATRLWLDRFVPLPNPSNVLAGFEATTGGTLFDLNALQSTEFGAEPGSVIEVDLYHANQLLLLPDDVVVKQVKEKYLSYVDKRYSQARVLDSSVLRFKNAVTLFGPGSHRHMPSTTTTFSNVFFAGDWLQQGPGCHGARGLSQEKAYVTGLLAAKAAALSQGVNTQVQIKGVEADEVHIAAAKQLTQGFRLLGTKLGISSPFLS